MQAPQRRPGPGSNRPRARACRAGVALALAVACLALALPVRAAHQCLDDAAVCIDTLEQDGTVSFQVSNHSPAPYSVRLVLSEHRNLAPRMPLPFRAVLEPGEERVIGSLVPQDPRAGTSHRFRWDAAAGSMLARHDDRWHYRMPFGGDRPRPLGQGVGGRFSHQGPARYAFDFSMPWGTPVLAARAGRVIRVVDAYTAGGARPRRYEEANLVDVLHADGTIATYAHLRRGAAVEVGQSVAPGDLLGMSGDTGFTTGPHLHFMVWRRLPDLGWASVPIRFHDGSAQGFVPGPGLAYAPACARASGRCGPDEPMASASLPAAAAPAARPPATRRSDGACACSNGAVIHVALPCDRVCGGSSPAPGATGPGGRR